MNYGKDGDKRSKAELEELRSVHCFGRDVCTIPAPLEQE